MGKSLEELRADAMAADQAYQEALNSGEDKLRAIAKQQDKGIRPEYRQEYARDEHGNPVKLDRNGNPEWRSGQKIEAARARPVYVPPLRAPALEKDAPPPDIDFKGTGTWDQTKNLWYDLYDAIMAVQTGKLSQEDREGYVQQIIPSILDRLAGTVPRVDCAFADGPMSKGSWMNLVGRYQMAFNPSKSLERSIGTMRSRAVPEFISFATDGAKWLFRRCPSGIPSLNHAKYSDEGDSNPDTGPHVSDAPRKRGRPKKVSGSNE
jgi:hypothetical protein